MLQLLEVLVSRIFWWLWFVLTWCLSEVCLFLVEKKTTFQTSCYKTHNSEEHEDEARLDGIAVTYQQRDVA